MCLLAIELHPYNKNVQIFRYFHLYLFIILKSSMQKSALCKNDYGFPMGYQHQCQHHVSYGVFYYQSMNQQIVIVFSVFLTLTMCHQQSIFVFMDHSEPNILYCLAPHSFLLVSIPFVSSFACFSSWLILSILNHHVCLLHPCIS